MNFLIISLLPISTVALEYSLGAATLYQLFETLHKRLRSAGDVTCTLKLAGYSSLEGSSYVVQNAALEVEGQVPE